MQDLTGETHFAHRAGPGTRAKGGGVPLLDDMSPVADFRGQEGVEDRGDKYACRHEIKRIGRGTMPQDFPESRACLIPVLVERRGKHGGSRGRVCDRGGRREGDGQEYETSH